MFGNKAHATNRGQAMIEFALIIVVLLMLIFVIVEGARIFQANLTVQNAARAAGRYATTGQYDSACLLEDPPCDDPRVASIKAVAREALAGLSLDDNAVYEEPGYYLIEVFGTDEDGAQIPDYAGIPGAPVAIRVTYRVGMVTPLIRPIAQTVRVIGQVVMNNEQYVQVSTSGGNDVPPQITPLPTPGASPTPTPPDLELVKTDSADPAIIGEDLQYRIDIVNLSSDSDATGVLLVDQLPDEVDFVDATAGCTYASGPHDVTCDLGTIVADGGTSVMIDVIPQTMPPSGDTITNNAGVTLNEVDPNSGNNSDSENTQLVQNPTAADLVLSKGASSVKVAVNDPIVYSISVLNDAANPAGLADAENVTVTDTLPPQVSFDSASTSVGSCSHDGSATGGTVTCDLGTMTKGQAESISIRVSAKSQAETVENYAVVESPTTPDPDLSNNDDTAVVEIINVADVGITKSASPDAGVGDPLVYTLNIINNGPAEATNVVVTDALPDSVQYVSNDSGCTYDGIARQVQCTVASIADGAGVNIKITVLPLKEGTIHNFASVIATQDDDYGANDSFDLATVVHARADIEVNKTGPGTGMAGTSLHYVVNVTNNGPSTATGIILTDQLPTGMTIVAASASQGTCAPANIVTCGLGNLAQGATATVHIYGIPGSGGTYVNEASAISTTIDPFPNNNTSSWQTVVSATQPYIVLDKICGEPGDEIVVQGFNWPTNAPANFDIALEWLAASGAAPDLLTITSAPTDNPFADDPLDWTRTIEIPSAADGTHVIRAERRNGNNVQAKDTAEFEVPCPAPNLVISEPVLVSPAQPVVGEPVVFTATISNIGNLDAVSQFFAGIYFDPDPAPTLGTTTHIAQAYRAGLVAINGLAVNASKPVTFTLPAGFDSDGSHDVYTAVDSDPGPFGVIAGELNETDNIAGPITVDVDPAAPGPTPTATATAIPGPTPEPGTLIGEVFFVDGFPQGNVELNLFDENDGSLVATTFSGINGSFAFNNLDPGTYALIACITIEENGVFHDYYAVANPIDVPPGGLIEQNLYLYQEDGACS